MEASRVRLTFSEKNNPVGELREAPHAYSDAIVGVSNHPISLVSRVLETHLALTLALLIVMVLDQTT